MALPTGISTSTWASKSSNDEKSTLEESSKVSAAISPTPEALEIVYLLSGSDDATRVTSAPVLQRDLNSSISPVKKPTHYPDAKDSMSNSEMGMTIKVPVSSAMVTTLSNTSSKVLKGEPNSSVSCTPTAAHDEVFVTATVNYIPSSPVDKLERNSDAISVQENPGCGTQISELENNSKKSFKMNFIDKYSSSSLSTSVDTNIDCENGSCEGTEIKCKICGKIVPKHSKDSTNSLFRGCVLSDNSMTCTDPFIKNRNVTGRNIIPDKSLNLGSINLYSRVSGSAHSFKKQLSPKYTSTLFSSSNRSMKKNDARRCSVDVLYAREPMEPDIEKIKSKRRLSRQTDISSFEFKTLIENSECDDICVKTRENLTLENTRKSSNKIKQYEIPATNSAQPYFPPCQELVADSSTDSCPKVPWNSLETNPSSQDIEDGLLNAEESSAVHNARDEDFYCQESACIGIEADPEEGGKGSRYGEMKENPKAHAEFKAEDLPEEAVDSAPSSVRKKEKQPQKNKKKRKYNEKFKDPDLLGREPGDERLEMNGDL
ncbi:hypothetical protein SK128_000616 [Halocaridina rubra]|uniref:Uncharacterized protein n=1 Tax=Halocaridina rubra TaxID=373956 RepID=A0AAN8ZVI4_HALRR